MATTSALEVDKSYFIWRGGLGVLLGIVVLIWPGLTVLTLVTFLSIWLLLIGALSILGGVASIKQGGYAWLVSVVVGIFELGVGSYLVQRPKITTLAIVTLIGAVFVVHGLVYLVKTFTETAITSAHRLLLLIFAGLSFVAGIWLWRYPFHGSLAFVWLLGLYAIISGALLIAIGAEVKE